jgi:hypothetical protein
MLLLLGFGTRVGVGTRGVLALGKLILVNGNSAANKSIEGVGVRGIRQSFLDLVLQTCLEHQDLGRGI